MPTCTEAERKVLDEALKSKASYIDISALEVAVYLETQTEILERLVAAEMACLVACQQRREAYDAINGISGAACKKLIEMGEAEAEKRMARRLGI